MLLYIILGIILLLFLLLLFPAVVSAGYSDSFKLTVSYLFIPFRVFPKKAKRKRKTTRPAKRKSTQTLVRGQKKKESPIKSLIKDRGLGGALRLLKRVASLAGGAFSKVLRGVRVTRFDLDISVGGSDAAAAAINYGKLCALIYPSVGLISSRTKSFRKNVSIRPDFLSEETKVYHRSRWVVIPLLVLIHAAAAFLKFTAMEAKEASDTTKPESKQ